MKFFTLKTDKKDTDLIEKIKELRGKKSQPAFIVDLIKGLKDFTPDKKEVTVYSSISAPIENEFYEKLVKKAKKHNMTKTELLKAYIKKVG